MQLPEEPDLEGEINILPMIDVIFSILAAFIISTLFLTRSETLPVNLPSANTTQTQSSTEINLTISNEGELFLNREAVALENLRAKVSTLIAAGSEKLVIINADQEVNHGRVVEVMDDLRQIEGLKLAIAAKKEAVAN